MVVGDISMFTLEWGWFWNLIWVLVVVILFLLFYRVRGWETYQKKGTEQTSVFLSGNKEASPEELHVRQTTCKGFTTGMKSLYSMLRKKNTANISDYILWLSLFLRFCF
jgi:hypothetical protein